MSMISLSWQQKIKQQSQRLRSKTQACTMVISNVAAYFQGFDSLGFSLHNDDNISQNGLFVCFYFSSQCKLSLNLGRVVPSSNIWLGTILVPGVRIGSWHRMQNSLKCYQGVLLTTCLSPTHLTWGHKLENERFSPGPAEVFWGNLNYY